jgi:acetate kinase
MTSTLLCLNSGSSSVKFAVYAYDQKVVGALLAHGKAELLDQLCHLKALDVNGQVLQNVSTDVRSDDIHEALLGEVLDWLKAHSDWIPSVAGHRVVHGGQHYTEAVLVDENVMQNLSALESLAPLHQPYNLEGIRKLGVLCPNLPQVACFDTAFHRSMPRLERLYGLPRDLTQEGIYRYGFHGLSYAYIASVLPTYLADRADGRVVVAHLGSGASLCGLHQRQSVASTMGFTALEGLMMGTRCGTLDPGVALYLLQEKKMDAKALEALLYKQSGLLGVSGVSSDMRALLSSSLPEAKEAVALFCYRVQRELGGIIAALQGIDSLVFTAGIGEGSAEVRRFIGEGLGWLGIQLDEACNEKGEGRISSASSRVDVWVIPTDEERMVAQESARVVAH